MAELLEPETGAEPGHGVDTGPTAIAVALDAARRRGRPGAADEVQGFLRDQRALIAKQLHHLDATMEGDAAAAPRWWAELDRQTQPRGPGPTEWARSLLACRAAGALHG